MSDFPFIPQITWRDTGLEEQLCSTGSPTFNRFGRMYQYDYYDFKTEILDPLIEIKNSQSLTCGEFEEVVRNRLLLIQPPIFPDVPTAQGSIWVTQPRYVVDNKINYFDANNPFSTSQSMGGQPPCPLNEGSSSFASSFDFYYWTPNNNIWNIVSQGQFLWRLNDLGTDYNVRDANTQITNFYSFPWADNWPIVLPTGTYSPVPPWAPPLRPILNSPRRLRVRLPSTTALDGGITVALFAPWLDMDAAVNEVLVLAECGATPPGAVAGPVVGFPGPPPIPPWPEAPGVLKPVFQTRIQLQNFTIPFNPMIFKNKD